MPEFSILRRARPESTSTARGLDDAEALRDFPTMYEYDGGPNGVVTVPIEIKISWGRL